MNKDNNTIPADMPMNSGTNNPQVGGIADTTSEKKRVIVDPYSVLPRKCWELYEKNNKGEIHMVILESMVEMMKRKIQAHLMGFEFLPEYYDFAEKIGISLNEFRNAGIIQKDFGFKDQRGSETINYIKAENGDWIIK